MSESIVAALLDAIQDAVWVVGRDGRVTRANAQFQSLWAKAFADDEWWADLTARVLAGRSVTADARLVVSGAERTFSVSGTSAGGEAVFVARDVTNLARGDRDDLLALAVTRMFPPDKPLPDALTEVLEFLCESDGWDCAAIWLIEPGGRQLYTAALWSRPDLDASKFHERMHELRFERGHGAPGRAWREGEVVWVADLFDETGFVRAETAAASGLHGLAAIPLTDSGRIIGVLEVFTRFVRPISDHRQRALAHAGTSLGRLIERHRLQDLIERKSVEWTTTFDGIELPIFITHTDGTILRVNRAARDLVGGTYAEVLGRSIAVRDGEPWTTLSDLVAAVRDSRGGCTAQIEEQERFWDVSASFSPVSGQERVILVMRETTDLVRLQESVRRGEQLAALGELVAGVAHEVRNPIFGMGLTVDALQAMLPQDRELAELAGVLRAWLDRLNRLMESLLEYGKTWTLDLRPGNVDEVLREVVEGSRQLAAQKSVAIDASIEPGLSILMDANRLSHAFENVISNAIHFSNPGDRVAVTARTVPEGDKEWIECSVRDGGPGFDPSDLPRVFQPFFTRRRGGTGLGLAIVQRVVDEHGGIIDAGNRPEGGASVSMRFVPYPEER